MSDTRITPRPTEHAHVFLGEGHQQAERRTWAVIALCAAMMLAEIVGGLLFGSIALVADGLHMSTHAGALLLAALAYRYARRYANDARFTFGTGKLGDLAGFSSAIILAMISVLIGYEAIARLFHPVPIRFGEAIPIAMLGLTVNVASVWLLSGGDHDHHHGHGHHQHADHEHAHDEDHPVILPGAAPLRLSVFEDDHPPVFRIRAEAGALPDAAGVSIETLREDGGRQRFTFVDRGDYLQSVEEIPEPHAFVAQIRTGGGQAEIRFAEHDHAHGAAHRDNNMRAAIVHVLADAAVSALVIVGLLLARAFGWLWMDPLAGLVGAVVIASWSYALVRATGAILLDMSPDDALKTDIRRTVEQAGDRLTDLHVWRLGPGHLGAIVSVVTDQSRGPEFYRQRLAHAPALSHLTVEIDRTDEGSGAHSGILAA